jgi:hypothetical protein
MKKIKMNLLYIALAVSSGATGAVITSLFTNQQEVIKEKVNEDNDCKYDTYSTVIFSSLQGKFYEYENNEIKLGFIFYYDYFFDGFSITSHQEGMGAVIESYITSARYIEEKDNYNIVHVELNDKSDMIIKIPVSFDPNVVYIDNLLYKRQ